MGAKIADPLFAARVKQEVERRLFGEAAGPLRVGRFELRERLGAGAMSVVYEAYDPGLQRSVALKLLQDDVQGGRLLREARALARLRHPHVVTVYEVGSWNEHVFLALEHVQGVTLGEWLRAAPRRPADVVRVLRDVADGLAAVHEHGLVHRDVKPENIIVDAGGAARLVDFGLVADSGVDETAGPDRGGGGGGETLTLTQPGGTPGTPRYMAPERRAGAPATPATDQFSFAVTLDEALAGLRVPAAVRSAARRGCAAEPAARFATMRAMSAALEPPSRRRLALAAGAVVASAAALLLLTHRDDACGAGAGTMAAHWSAARRAGFAPAIAAAVDAYAAGWVDVKREVCRRALALPGDTGAELNACLDGRLAALDDVLGAPARADLADRVAELPPLDDCRPLDAVAGADPPVYVQLVQGTAREDARAAQRAGLRALRDGDRNLASESFKAAARLDPGYGAAYLWSALLMSHGNVHVAREAFARAVAVRAGMSAANRALLAALVPCIQADPPDDLECEARLGRAAEASPRNAYLWYELARHRWNREGPSPAVVDTFTRALDADPGFALARFAQAQTLAYLGRFDEALATTDECLRQAPGATACLHDRAWIHAQRGECDAVADDARRWRAAAPSDTLAYAFLASAAKARGAPVETVAELLREAAADAPEEDRAFFAARDEALAAIDRGDFVAAPAKIDAMDATLAHTTERASRLLAPRLRILVALEVGDRDGAAALAAQALARSGAWAPDPRAEDFAIARDFEPVLLDVLRETGRLDDAARAARRQRWLAAWQARAAPANHPFLWLAAYARNVDDASEAAEALAALPGLGGVAPFHPLAYPDAGLGRMYLHAGRPIDAIPFLRRAAGACHAVEFTYGIELGWDAVHAARDLGAALEQTGDVPGACAAYARVLAAWGHARPRSVTAEDARARRGRLACPGG